MPPVLLAIPLVGSVIKFFISPLGSALGIIGIVVAAWLFIDARAREQEREACNQRAEQSQQAARQIDQRAGDNAASADRNFQSEIDALWARNKELIDELDEERSKPPTVVKNACPDGDRLTADDVKRLRRIPER